MSTPNVAVAFPPTVRTNITTKIDEAMALFPVLATISTEQKKKLSGISEGREAYVADAYSDARANPATVPGTVNVTDWGLLEEQHAGLAQMESYLLVQLEKLQDTKALVADRRYKFIRKYYDYLGGNLDDLPGAEPIYERISRLYAGQGGSGTPPAGGTPPPA